MENASTKKEMRSQYAEREIIGGVYIIRNLATDRLLLLASTDLQGSKNRFSFAQNTGSCVDLKLQQDWTRLGGSQFALEVLEELKKGETQTAAQFKDDIDTLKEIWREKLADKDLY